MSHSIDSPLTEDVSPAVRAQFQEYFGRHIVQARDRMASIIINRLFGDANHPIPVVDRKLAPIRSYSRDEQAAIKAAVLDAADQMVAAVLTVFSQGNDTSIGGSRVVNYAIIAQERVEGSDTVVHQIDINRGEPVIAIFDNYRKWLSRYSSSELRP
jgi:hypothetical protein